MYPSHVLSSRVSHQRARILLIGLFLALMWTSPAFSAPVQNNPDNRANAEALTYALPVHRESGVSGDVICAVGS